MCKIKDGPGSVAVYSSGCKIMKYELINKKMQRAYPKYFFDEPDAALDVIKQKEIYELVKKKSQNKICIYVSHKIGHICKEADAIIILKNGRIEDIGLHDELIQKNAYYKQLYLKSTE